MKKYLQITIVLAVFVVAVLIKHITGNSSQPQVLAQSNGGGTTNTNALPPLPTEAPAESASQPSSSQSAVVSSSGVPVVTPTTAAAPTATPQSQAQPVKSASTAPPTATPTPQTAGQYKDGVYTGSVANAYYGYMQVKVTIQGGKITDVVFLQHPDHAYTSVRINTIAMPMLKQEALQAQSYHVNIISGASASSIGFINSLATALQQAS